jgi:hypothetical protein
MMLARFVFYSFELIISFSEATVTYVFLNLYVLKIICTLEFTLETQPYPNLFNPYLYTIRTRVGYTDKGCNIRASPVVLSNVIVQKYFSHPSLVIYFLFSAPSVKLKQG